MCRFIPGDANLYSMFRVDGAPVACPFRGPLAFAYDRGKGECAWPPSQMESCTDPRRVAFRYQACPNVVGSEMRSESPFRLNQGEREGGSKPRSWLRSDYL